MVVYIMLLCLLSDLNYIYVLVRFYICIYICMFWSNLNCKFEFFGEKMYCRAAGTVAAPTNRFVRAVWEPSLQIHDL